MSGPLTEPNWSYLRAGWGIFLFGLAVQWAGAMSNIDGLWGFVIAALGLVMVLYSLRPTVASVFAPGRKARVEKRKTEQRKQDETRARLQLTAAERFLSAGREVLTLHSRYRDGSTTALETEAPLREAVERASVLVGDMPSFEQNDLYDSLECLGSFAQHSKRECELAHERLQEIMTQHAIHLFRLRVNKPELFPLTPAPNDG